MEKRVELFIPKGSALEEPNWMIGLNGVNYLLPRGKTSLVPPAVAAEYYRSQQAMQQQEARMDEMQSR